MADIELTQNWTPLGDGTNKFTGIFDGNYYKITGLKTTSTSANNQGFFGVMSGATIKNASIEGDVVRFDKYRSFSWIC